MTGTLVSCTRWSVTDRPLPELLAEEGPRPGSLRIFTVRGDEVVLQSPRLRSDSVIGIGKGGFVAGVPVSEVRMVQRLQVDAGKTVGLAVFTVGTVAGIIAMQDMKTLFRE